MYNNRRGGRHNNIQRDQRRQRGQRHNINNGGRNNNRRNNNRKRNRTVFVNYESACLCKYCFDKYGDKFDNNECKYAQDGFEITINKAYTLKLHNVESCDEMSVMNEFGYHKIIRYCLCRDCVFNRCSKTGKTLKMVNGHVTSVICHSDEDYYSRNLENEIKRLKEQMEIKEAKRREREQQNIDNNNDNNNDNDESKNQCETLDDNKWSEKCDDSVYCEDTSSFCDDSECIV